VVIPLKAQISGVVPGSIAADIGINKGDFLISINETQPLDLIDYRYLTSEEFVILEIEKPSGEHYLYEIEKDEDEDLGIIYNQDTFDGIKKCHNKCIFCFMDQMPSNLRDSLYIKDDDYRLSFLHGNFITLTNLSQQDLNRIKNLHISPLYISVHSTNDTVRKKMMNNPRAAGIHSLLQDLAQSGIQIHTQIVLCPDINDGEILKNSVSDLAKLWPQVQSVAVVPVGLTKFNKNKDLRLYNSQEARKIVNNVTLWQYDFHRSFSSNFVYLADEFYLLAGLKVPPAEHYDGFPQIENGVGLIRQFWDSFMKATKLLPPSLQWPRSVALVTGKAAAPILNSVMIKLNRINNLSVDLIELENDFFGKSVTVAGLLTGHDILLGIKTWQKKHHKIIKEMIIPSVMLKSGDNLFLDGTTVEHLSHDLKMKITVIEPTGKELIKALIST
jgi:putative radical SAM enzyme (TIGR03279 family)